MKTKKLENFRKTLRNLEELRKEKEPYSIVATAGLVSLFQQCFELSWQAMKEYLSYEGWSAAQTGSPREIIKTAYEAGLIQDETAWLQAMRARNLITHTYNEEDALNLITDEKNIYLPLFERLAAEFDKRLAEEKT